MARFPTRRCCTVLAKGFQQTYIVEKFRGSGQALVAVNAPPSPIPTSGTVEYTFVFGYSFGTSPLDGELYAGRTDPDGWRLLCIAQRVWAQLWRCEQ